jgi:hypothetical protein
VGEGFTRAPRATTLFSRFISREARDETAVLSKPEQLILNFEF